MNEDLTEPDTTDANPAEIVPTNIAGELAGDEHAGAPTAEELAADPNLFPQPDPTGDDVADGTAVPDVDDLPEESSEGHENGDV